MPCTNDSCNHTICRLQKFLLCPRTMIIIFIFGVVMMMPRDQEGSCSVCCVYKMVLKTACGFLELCIQMIEMPLTIFCGTKTKLNMILQYVMQKCCNTPCCAPGAKPVQEPLPRKSSLKKASSVKLPPLPSTVAEEPPLVHMQKEKVEEQPVPKASISVVEMKRSSIASEPEQKQTEINEPESEERRLEEPELEESELEKLEPEDIGREEEAEYEEPEQDELEPESDEPEPEEPELEESEPEEALEPETVESELEEPEIYKSESIIAPKRKSTSIFEQEHEEPAEVLPKEPTVETIESIREPSVKKDSTTLEEREHSEESKVSIESKEPTAQNVTKESKESKVQKEPKIPKELKIPKEQKIPKETKEKYSVEGVCKRYHPSKCLKCRCAKRKEAREKRSFEQARYKDSNDKIYKEEKKGTIPDFNEISEKCCGINKASKCIGTEQCCLFKGKKRQSVGKKIKKRSSTGSKNPTSIPSSSTDSKRQGSAKREKSTSKRSSVKASASSRRSSMKIESVGSKLPSARPSIDSTAQSVQSSYPSIRPGADSKHSSATGTRQDSKRSRGISNVESQMDYPDDQLAKTSKATSKTTSEESCPGGSACSLSGSAVNVKTQTKFERFKNKGVQTEAEVEEEEVTPQPKSCLCYHKELCRDTCCGNRGKG